MAKPLAIESLFATHPALLKACFAEKSPESDIAAFIENVIPNRRRTSKTRTNVLRFVLSNYDFATTRHLPRPGRSQ